MLYSNQGTLKAEDAMLLTLARQQVRTALVNKETKINRLIDQLIPKIDARLARYDADQLLQAVENHRQLTPEQVTLSRYSGAFPELKEKVSASNERILRQARARLVEAVAPFQYQRRFAHTAGLRY